MWKILFFCFDISCKCFCNSVISIIHLVFDCLLQKKVDPKLQVEVKPSIRARKIQEEKLKRQSQKEEYWRRRDLEERWRVDRRQDTAMVVLGGGKGGGE